MNLELDRKSRRYSADWRETTQPSRILYSDPPKVAILLYAVESVSFSVENR